MGQGRGGGGELRVFFLGEDGGGAVEAGAAPKGLFLGRLHTEMAQKPQLLFRARAPRSSSKWRDGAPALPPGKMVWGGTK